MTAQALPGSAGQHASIGSVHMRVYRAAGPARRRGDGPPRR
jgi:hypothetical protein